MRDAKRAKPARTKVEPELAAARKALRNEAAKRRDLEKGLAESLGREKATGEILKEAGDRHRMVGLGRQGFCAQGFRNRHAADAHLKACAA